MSCCPTRTIRITETIRSCLPRQAPKPPGLKVPVTGCAPAYTACFDKEQAAALARYLADLRRWQREVEAACTIEGGTP